MDKRTEDFIATRIPEPNKAKQNNPVVVFLKDLETKMKAWNAAPAVISVAITGAADIDVDNGSVQLGVTVTVRNGASQAVTWTSDDELVATVDNTGLVSAVANGTVNITATSDFDNTKSDSVAIVITSQT